MTKIDPKVEKIIRFVTENLETESAFLTPFPVTTIEVSSLFDEIAKVWSIDKKDIGKIVDEIQDAKIAKLNKKKATK